MSPAARIPALLLGLLLGTGCADDGAPAAVTPSSDGKAPLAAPPHHAAAPAPGPPPPAAGRLDGLPDIVLVTIDTLRREHLGCYGYFRPTSPHLDALAAEGLVFDRALASMSSTLPSHLTMLTGLYPHQHGMNSNLRGAVHPFLSEPGRRSAAEILLEAGYRTAAFVSAIPLSPKTGVSVGFQTYACPNQPLRAGERNPEVLAWLEKQAPRPGPLFLWVHYFDPHEPNDPVAPYDKMFPTDERQEQWIDARHLDYPTLTEKLARNDRIQRHFLPSEKRGARSLRSERNRKRLEALGMKPRRDRKGQDASQDGPAKPGEEVDRERIADLMNRYDGEVRYADDHMGELIGALRRLGRFENAIVVVVGDHGQSLGENNWFGHGTPSQINTLVPLVVRFPAGLVEPGRVQALVSLADLMPTLLGRFELPGSEALRAQFQGEDVLSGAFVRNEVLVGRSTDIRIPSDPGRVYALLAGDWKYLHRDEGQDELYDLAGAGEFVNVLADEPEIGARLRTRTLELLASHAAEADEEADSPGDEQLLQDLQDLGYGGEDED